MPSNVRVVVLAKSLRDFHAWCRETEHSPRDRGVLYAVGPYTLRGLRDVEFVRYGDWRDRLDGRDLEEAVAALEQRQALALETAA